MRRDATRDPYFRDESKPSAVNGPDESLAQSVISERLTRRFHATCHRGVGNHPTVPDFFDDFVLRNEPAMILDEKGEQPKDLRLQVAGDTVRAQLHGDQVQLEGTEPVDHAC